jgi:hypothetical protein
MKRNKILTLIVLFFLSSSLFAQRNSKESRLNQMHERKWQFLVEQADLSPSEVELVKPIFLEYETALWAQHEKNKEFFHSVMKTESDVKPNYAQLNDQYSEIEYVQGQLFRNYHQKLRKLLKPETLFKYYKAEREFKRKLLQNIQDRANHRPDMDNFN